MKSKITFLTIGYIEWRKGQDLLVEAFEKLPSELFEKAELILVGQNTSQLAQSIAERISNNSRIRMTGTLSREEVHELLDKADVLICPSREDPMPTVCAEAMMHGVPCLVSDATGTSGYIKDGYDGLVFSTGDIQKLSEKIIWCIENQNDLTEMGDRAREIFKRFFSQNVFEKKLLGYVEEMIGRA